MPKPIKSSHIQYDSTNKKFCEFIEKVKEEKEKIDIDEDLQKHLKDLELKIEKDLEMVCKRAEVIEIDLDSDSDTDVGEVLVEFDTSEEEKFRKFLEDEKKIVEELSKEHSMVKIRRRIHLKNKMNSLFYLLSIPFRFSHEKEDEEVRECFSKLLLRNSTMLEHIDRRDGVIDYDYYRGMRNEKFRLQMAEYLKLYKENLEYKNVKKRNLEKIIRRINGHQTLHSRFKKFVGLN